MNQTISITGAHDLLADQAAADPAALAIRDERQQLTYAELEQRANRLARHIQSYGIGPDTPVALYFDRSIHFVVAALAVLKSGGGYVPLDPAYPPGRIDEILKDAGVRLLLSHKWMAAGLAGGPWKTVDLDIDAAAIAAHSCGPPLAELDGHNVAYIIYTSGSTGRPKGVEVTHSNLLHLIRWHRRAFGVSAADRASQIAGLGFDAAVWEIWCHLAAGASVHMIDERSRRSPEALKDWLSAERITIAFVPTILAEHLITFAWPKDTSLRTLLTGADTLHRYPPTGLPFTLVNNYGPTECTVLVTSGPVITGSPGRLPTIGRPIDDTQILIRDAGLAPVPEGEPGEICVAGPQVARGYRNLPELTAQKFVPDPATGQRMYRTADLGRVLPSGEIAFLGRLDDQIKIRGFRVEPDDIAAQLNSHPQVTNSVVVAQGDNADEKALVAYLILSPESALTAAELRSYLLARLPDYMIPSSYVSLSAFPLTTSGKCDKQALPERAPANLLPESDETAAFPDLKQTSTEARITQLMSGLMGGRAISPDDNIFLVGGHSMLAAQLIARLRESFAVSLSLRQLFESPTIAALSSLVDRKLGTK